MKEPENGSVCDEIIYQQVYNKNASTIRNFLYYKCGSLAKAEDIMHEAFIKLWENCGSVILEKSKSFLFTVANRLFLNHVSHQKVVLAFEKNTFSNTNKEDPSFQMEEKEFKHKLESAISSLSEGQREVFLLNRMDKLSYKEIAAMLDISVKAVEKRMHLALIALKKSVDELKIHKI